MGREGREEKNPKQICRRNEDAASSPAVWWMSSRGVTSSCSEVGSTSSRLHQLSASFHGSKCGNCLKDFIYLFIFFFLPPRVLTLHVKGRGCNLKCAHCIPSAPRSESPCLRLWVGRLDQSHFSPSMINSCA